MGPPATEELKITVEPVGLAAPEHRREEELKLVGLIQKPFCLTSSFFCRCSFEQGMAELHGGEGRSESEESSPRPSPLVCPLLPSTHLCKMVCRL